MEEAFEKLKKEGKTDVDTLIKWMKESNIIGQTKAVEEEARALFADAANKQAIEFAKFKEALGKLATKQKKAYDDFVTQLSTQGPKIIDALRAGASAAVEALKKK